MKTLKEIYKYNKYRKIEPYISQYNWKERNFSSHIKYWKKFETVNKTIVLNVLFSPSNKEERSKALKITISGV